MTPECRLQARLGAVLINFQWFMDHNHTKHCKISKIHQLFKELVWDRKGERKGILRIRNIRPKHQIELISQSRLLILSYSHWGHCHSNWISGSLTSNWWPALGPYSWSPRADSGLIRSVLVTPAEIIWTWPVIKVRFGHIVNTPDQRENMANMLIWCQVITTFKVKFEVG